MNQNTTLFDSLQREFCPPLDSSLLAALLADLESDAKGNSLSPSPRQVDDFRVMLRELSMHADELQLSEFSDLHLASTTDDTSSTPEFYHGNTATSSSLDSDSPESSQHPFSSPLGFLQAALPHIPTATLRSALESAGNGEIDMWDVVAGILTAESIRELEERGLDAIDEDDLDVLQEDERSWMVVKTKRKPSKVPIKKGNREKVITLGDVRQRVQHMPKRRNTDLPHSGPPPDPWTQLSSLSSHLATLIPPYPASFFQSYFHSPEHPSPYLALNACLTSICKNRLDSPPEEHTDKLFTLLDILLPEYEELNSEERSRLVSDIEISLSATGGSGDQTLDLVKLLRELDSDANSYFEMGIYHTASPPLPVNPRRKPRLPSGPPVVQPPPQTRPKPKSSPSLPQKPSPYEWQTVPQRQIPHHDLHPLALYIPAYAHGRNVKGAGNAFGQGDTGELYEYRRKAQQSMRKRNELLLQASRMWQRGNSKTRGGEAASYFAERAREFEELARIEALNAARTMVESKRTASNDQTTVDLHGTTVAEAVAIIKEILHTQKSSPANPLKIITGRGKHSVNQVGVLKPAIRKALTDDGWTVGSWDAGLVVRGKRVTNT